jgi:uncharacterized protein (DUF488 family)
MRQLVSLLERGVLASLVEQMPEKCVLMCWEDDPRTCHRLIAANFLATNFSDRVVYLGEYKPHTQRTFDWSRA